MLFSSAQKNTVVSINMGDVRIKCLLLQSTSEGGLSLKILNVLLI